MKNVRTLLGRCLSNRPRKVPIVPNRFGKPGLESKTLFFDFSQAGDVMLIAVCRDHEIGVDGTLDEDAVSRLPCPERDAFQGYIRRRHNTYE